jgi:hypothetical protein
MQMVCGLEALDDSPKEILTDKGAAATSLGPTAGNKVTDAVALKEVSGSLIFFRARFCIERVSTRDCVMISGFDLLEDSEKLGATVGTNAKILRNAGGLKSDALGATP